METGAISVEAVTRRFGDLVAVDNLSFEVQPGEIFGLLGPNGAGKTTTIHLITGMLRRDSGEVRVLGSDPQTKARQVRQQIGYVPQETNVYLDLNAVDNLLHHAALYCRDLSGVKERIEDSLRLMNLWERRKDAVGTFSGGMKRRLALARALLHDPRVVLFDEPTLGVDVQGRHVLWDHIKAQQAQGKTFVVSTNDMAEADALCERLLIVDHGRAIALDSPETLKSDLETRHRDHSNQPSHRGSRCAAVWTGGSRRQASGAPTATLRSGSRRVDRGRTGLADHGQPPTGVSADCPSFAGRRLFALHRARTEGVIYG